MGCSDSDMVALGNLGFLCFRRRRLGLFKWVVFGLWFGLLLLQPVVSLRPLRERARSWGDEVGKILNWVFLIGFVHCFLSIH